MKIIKSESDYNMIDWWKKVVLENYANFEGRARRSEYWYFVLGTILLYLSLALISGILAALFQTEAFAFVFITAYILISLGLFIPTLAVIVRRLHDTGKSGWFYLIGLIPLGGIILLVFYCEDSEPGSNKWGSNPKEEKIEELI